jgi:glycosyltransferase involved in cell wall biosynthesis
MKVSSEPVRQDVAPKELAVSAESRKSCPPAVALLTAGKDQPYAFGLATALTDQGLTIDLITGDELDTPYLRNKQGINLLNLRGDQTAEASFVTKITRVVTYYFKLVRYALTSRTPIFHILWNNKFEVFDRTLLMLYYRLLRKRIVMTLHNVNAGRRDKSDSWVNRATLRMQYRLADHLFVHTELMRAELVEEFGIQGSKITVIPFGINNAAPQTDLSVADAKQRLGLAATDKTILFFGRITPYKGLEYLIAGFRRALASVPGLRLIIAGRADQCEDYWQTIREDIQSEVESGQILLRAEFIPDAETEIYFKAADALVLPYREIYQSGVLILAKSFGLPVLVSDAGCLKESVVEGQNGFAFARDSDRELAGAIDKYFRSDLYAGLGGHREEIRERAAQEHSWNTVARMTTEVYRRVDGRPGKEAVTEQCSAAGPTESTLQ